ncbi:amidohydrolase family protein [Solirubrobacter ginsenosidimutans]|uniref:Amidohydrolase family protein n=1 Tax=Solirubrobacter ginsenosidimutans TaxID=490573 RepID=A0A9X3MN89_9ACTN|nr:amidohydrolase family protein [Solirubrobacter ginsenosidimutans]MDA0159235.1 amidohydrolase family protein [Solirubrobacter ginsenosidimutans]
MIVDAHAHAFPTEASGHEWQRLLGVDEPRRTGEIGELAEIVTEAGIDRTVVLLNVRAGERFAELQAAGAPDAREQVREQLFALNRWGCRLGREDARFLPFIGVNVRFLSPAELVEEIDRGVAEGARGVKIIPPSMRVYADDPLLRPVVQRCCELGLPLLSQSGSGGGDPPAPGADHYGRPGRWDAVLREFADLKLILAHLGHGYEEDIVRLCASHEHVYTDTSMRLSRLGQPGQPTEAELVALIRRIGAERVLLGTNYPFVSPAAYVARLGELPFTDAERALVGGENFVRAVGV